MRPAPTDAELLPHAVVGALHGDVTEVRVNFNEARYGTNLCGSNVCSTVWALVRDAIAIWTAGKIAGA